MINDKELIIEINGDDIVIKVDEKEKLKVNINKKSINTKDIYELLEYDVNNKYNFKCAKKDESELQGKQGEINRLYNYTHELFEKMINTINEINEKERAKRAKE